ncbi:MAG: DUF2254 domain-containing protein [Prosthecobacter sp.]|jgi:uncharacterized membrane protein|uniref:DUF2254 domain-containing protein n=1 Tax=Prosthecobacter sp. TaxID=1965333 RepID=UPI0019F474A4|nr:DUF2254 domain-containing protein [Prosthecobacter sp.]MBE2287507.1 DUF2254 domain-containing protein [Prosthecobacter sp.]
MNRLKRLWNSLRDSFWFFPSLIVALSMVFAVSLIEVDATPGIEGWLALWPRVFGASAEGARGMLSTIAGSMMTVVGVTFSMILVTLTLASTQYTSRILRNFVRDRVTQVVLGLFASVFTFCLIVLRTIRGGDESGFVPSIAVTVAVFLAIGGIGVLIFFIHHIAIAIQASSIMAAVAGETIAAVDRLFPDRLGDGMADQAAGGASRTVPAGPWQCVSASRSGYIQSLETATLLRVAKERKTVIRMERGIGEFVVQDTPLVSLIGAEPPDEDVCEELRDAYGIDRHRTVEQDAGFGIRQLVDMALRALSPGVNDTTTAVMCVDYLTAILARLATRDIPSSHRHEDGELRVIAIGPTFASLVDESFDQIRESSDGNLAMMLQLLGGLHTIGSLTGSKTRRQMLLDHAQGIAEQAERSLKSARDHKRFRERHAWVRACLEGGDAA